MGAIPPVLITIGLIFLTHAVYSAHEHALLPSLPQVTAAAPTDIPIAATHSLPRDIIAETLVSVLLLCVGIVLGAPELKPIQWRVWAGRIEKEKQQPLRLGRGGQAVDDGGVGVNPFLALEQRAGFLDIRGARAEFAKWVKEGKL